MRKIDELAKTAFIQKRRFKLRNTEVCILNGKPHLYLHSNLIAKLNDQDELLIKHCGWETVTTKSRLNAFYGVNIRLFKGSFILNEQGYMKNEWYNINKL
jgi:hypothetical protein